MSPPGSGGEGGRRGGYIARAQRSPAIIIRKPSHLQKRGGGEGWGAHTPKPHEYESHIGVHGGERDMRPEAVWVRCSRGRH